MPTASPPASDVTKERLAFVSTSVLAWGLLLLTLRPRVNRMYTGVSIRYGQTDWYVGDRLSAGALSFFALNVLVALGVCILVLAAAHLVCRGSSMRRRMPGTDSDTTTTTTELADVVYDGMFSVTVLAMMYLVGFVPPLYLATLIQHWLVGMWSVGRVISTGVVTIPFVVWVFVLVRVGPRVLRRTGMLDYLNPISTFVVAMLLLVCLIATIETAYTVELSLCQTFYSKEKTPMCRP